ncbi:UNVERIFIED_CONTAM: GAF domain-containing protein [Brevibacillus sp. OAP136]
MTEGKRVDELAALKEIAVTLNITNDTNHMLDAVLRKLLEVTGLTTGWIFLMENEPGYTCVVDHRLPPALSWGDKEPMCTGSCWCVDKYWGGRLHNAVNIINCKRIENAIEYKWGDTEGIYHHATVPLKAGEKWFGLLNVAAPGKEHFSDEELALLTAVAYQIGTALARTKLFHAEQKRAELYAKLGDASKAIGAVTELQKNPLYRRPANRQAFSVGSGRLFLEGRQGDFIAGVASGRIGQGRMESGHCSRERPGCRSDEKRQGAPDRGGSGPGAVTAGSRNRVVPFSCGGSDPVARTDAGMSIGHKPEGERF